MRRVGQQAVTDACKCPQRNGRLVRSETAEGVTKHVILGENRFHSGHSALSASQSLSASRFECVRTPALLPCSSSRPWQAARGRARLAWRSLAISSAGKIVSALAQRRCKAAGQIFCDVSSTVAQQLPSAKLSELASFAGEENSREARKIADSRTGATSDQQCRRRRSKHQRRRLTALHERAAVEERAAG